MSWQQTGNIMGPQGATGSGAEVAGFTQCQINEAFVNVVFPAPQPNVNWRFRELRIFNFTDPAPLRLWTTIVTAKAPEGFTVQLNAAPDGTKYVLFWSITAAETPTGDATYYEMTGPASGQINEASTFTVKLPKDKTLSTIVTITPSDGGAGGTFAPATVQLSSQVPTAVFNYTPVSLGNKTISVTNNGGLTNPTSLVLNVISRTYQFSGPSSGGVGVPSAPFTVQLPSGGAAAGGIIITPHEGLLTDAPVTPFNPNTVTISTGTPSATFVYTPASTGVKTLYVTNNSGLTDPSPLTYTVT
jgi:hypothetical protein